MIYIDDTHRLKFRYKHRKMLVYLNFVDFSSGVPRLRDMEFVFDTGAVGITMRREDFESLGYDKNKNQISQKYATKVGGILKIGDVSNIFGGIIGDIFDLRVSAHVFEVPTISEYDSCLNFKPLIRVPNKKGVIKRNLFGQRALEEFNYYIDNSKRYIYFSLPSSNVFSRENNDVSSSKS